MSFSQFCKDYKLNKKHAYYVITQFWGNLNKCPYAEQKTLPNNVIFYQITDSEALYKEIKNYKYKRDCFKIDITPMELQILACLANGVTNYYDIGKELFIARTTVSTHIASMFQKLQVKDKTQLLIKAIQKGYIIIERTKE